MRPVRQRWTTPDPPGKTGGVTSLYLWSGIEEWRAEAAEVLETTLAALRGLGRDAEGLVTDDDPVPALEAAAAQHGAREVVVVTRPHALEETFNRDWASRAREVLGLPVLHTYAGTGRVG